MPEQVPTYQLNVLSKNGEDVLDVFFLDGKIKNPKAVIDIPFRRNFYAVGICVRGEAELKINLETHHIKTDSLIIKPPYIINQWTYMSDDFETLTIFFARNFIAANHNINLDRFNFFESFARNVFQISSAQSAGIIASLKSLKEKYDLPHVYRNEILVNLIGNLLYEIAAIYDEQSASVKLVQTRSQFLASEFKKLVNAHFKKERSVKFYAGKLFLTPKHLSETVKEITGKAAGEWIAEAVILEAKVLLQDPALSVAQISDELHFSDQSAFGKFFKKNTGLSPGAYKQSF